MAARRERQKLRAELEASGGCYVTIGIFAESRVPLKRLALQLGCDKYRHRWNNVYQLPAGHFKRNRNSTDFRTLKNASIDKLCSGFSFLEVMPGTYNLPILLVDTDELV